MKLAIAALSAATLLAIGASASAEDLTLPAPSPLARVMQTVGVTEITVEYSSPGVKGRKIFGKLLPLSELWRTGANRATRITFSQDVKVADQDVPAGTYAIFTIPGKKMWTFILNKNADQGGTRTYDQALDQLRVEIKPKRVPKRERMTFLFSNTTDDATELELEWETTRLSVPITTDTAAHAAASIAGARKAAWRELASAARYVHAAGDADSAQALIDASVAIQEDFYNAFIKAQVHETRGDMDGAKVWAKKAWELGHKAEYFFWKDQVAEAMKKWGVEP